MATEKKRDDYAEGQNKYTAGERILKTDDPGSGPQGLVPDLSARIVIGIFEHADAAQAAMKDLQAAGYAHDDVSLVMQQPGSPPEIGAGETKANQGIVAGVSAGAVLGGIAGLMALSIPGVGAILAAGDRRRTWRAQRSGAWRPDWLIYGVRHPHRAGQGVRAGGARRRSGGGCEGRRSRG